MSMKPCKKSDSKKKWMSDRRDRRITIAPEYHLIVTEGTKTEPQYFEGFKNDINNLYRGRISIVIEGIGQGANTLTLLERAQKIAEKDPDKYKHIWLVYDMDDFPKDDFDNTYNRCKALSENCGSVIYHALWSNECIEYWFLLHFMALDSALNRNEYYPKLTECLGSKYEKNRKDIYTLLKSNIKEAINNAKRMETNNKGKPPSKCTPGTAVYEIFEMLEGYLS